MPPKQQKKKAGHGDATSEMDKVLRRIVEDASQLKREEGVVTLREVKALREAFESSVPPNLRATHQLAVQCDNLLHSLEKKASPASPVIISPSSSQQSRSASAPSSTGAAAAAAASASAADHSVGADTKKAAAAAQSSPKKSIAAASARGGSWGEDLTVNWKFTDIPMERRIQTFIVTLCCFFTGLPFTLGISAFLLYWSYTRWFMVAYIICIFVFPVRHPSKPWRRFIDSSFFKYYRDYFPVRLVIPKNVRRAFNNRRNYLMCYHPHGVHSFGALFSMGCNANNIYDILGGDNKNWACHVQTLGIQFYVPFWREMCRWAGMGDASAKTIERTLRSGPGQCVGLVVGGAEESMLAAPHTNDLLLSKRKGFVKIALRTGAGLVPVFGFGETNVYGKQEVPEWVNKLLQKLQKMFGFAFPLIKGRGWFNYNWGPLPHRKLIVTVFGEPLELPQISEPTQADVDKYHALYVQKLMDLYREHKAVYDLQCQTEAQVVK